MRKNIILVGFMGTGKSSVGHRLAQRLGMEFYDTDNEVEAVTGLDLVTLYQKHGRIRYESEEKLALNKLLMKENCVISTGGTLPFYEERAQQMRQVGLLVCLKAEPEMIQRRVLRKNNRPLLRKEHILEDICRLYQEQICWETVADLVIDTTNKSFEQIIQQISKKWEQEIHGVL